MKTYSWGLSLIVGASLMACCVAQQGASTPSSTKRRLRGQQPTHSDEHQQQQQPQRRRLATEDGDLEIRFNKFGLKHMAIGIEMMTMHDYPLNGDVEKLLRHDSTGVSVVPSDDFQLQKNSKMTAEEYIEVLGGYPTMPNSDPNHPFWTEMEEIVDWQLASRSNDDPNDLFRLPDLWQHRNISQVAEAVHDEYPAIRQTEFIEWLFANTKIKIDKSLFPFRSNADFIGSTIKIAHMNSWAIAAVGPVSFHLKWVVGRPRPEEIAYRIAFNHLTERHGVPTSLKRKVKSMRLRSLHEFTQYPEGAPKHPAWPAMHSAGSTMSFWMRIIMDLDDEHYCQALLTDYAVAMARTVAGVHYRADNIDGLNLGQQIIAEQLADKLADEYGSDRDVVQAKIDRERFDWRDFDPETCSIRGSRRGL